MRHNFSQPRSNRVKPDANTQTTTFLFFYPRLSLAEFTKHSQTPREVTLMIRMANNIDATPYQPPISAGNSNKFFSRAIPRQTQGTNRSFLVDPLFSLDLAWTPGSAPHPFCCPIVSLPPEGLTALLSSGLSSVARATGATVIKAAGLQCKKRAISARSPNGNNRK